MSELDFQKITKMQGYLEKKSKLKLCNWWRKQYFILEGKTLLCTKSKDDYRDNKSAAKIIVHFPNVNGIRPVYVNNPGSGRFQFEIITKGTSIVLASSDEETRSQWLTAFQEALQQSDISPPLKKKTATAGSTQSLSSNPSSIFHIPSAQNPPPRDHSNSQPNLTSCQQGGPTAVRLYGGQPTIFRLCATSTTDSTPKIRVAEERQNNRPPDLVADCHDQSTIQIRKPKEPPIVETVVHLRNKNKEDQTAHTKVENRNKTKYLRSETDEQPTVDTSVNILDGKEESSIADTIIVAKINPRQTVVLREGLKLKLLSVAPDPDRPRSSLMWRQSEVEFFWSERNADWPALSMDLCDELLEEIRTGARRLDESFESMLLVELKDMNTQTDFPDDCDFIHLDHVRAIRDELISYISTSASSSLANTPSDTGLTVWNEIDDDGEKPLTPDGTMDSDYDFLSANESCYVTAESSEGEL